MNLQLNSILQNLLRIIKKTFLLVETQTSELCDVSINGFKHMILNRTEKKPGTQRGIGGLSLYIKLDLFHENTFVICADDNILWFQLKNNIQNHQYIFVCVMCCRRVQREILWSILLSLADFWILLSILKSSIITTPPRLWGHELTCA